MVYVQWIPGSGTTRKEAPCKEKHLQRNLYKGVLTGVAGSQPDLVAGKVHDEAKVGGAVRNFDGHMLGGVVTNGSGIALVIPQGSLRIIHC